MSQIQPARGNNPLSYMTRPEPPATRVSKIAIAAPFVATLGSPCILGPLIGWLNCHVPVQFQEGGAYGRWQAWCMCGGLIATTVFPTTAIVRVLLSRNTRTGVPLAVFGVAISLLWWCLVGAIWLAVRNWHMD